MIVAGAHYLLNSFTLIVFPGVCDRVFMVLFLSFIGEFSFALWLLVKGVNKIEWNKMVVQAER